MARTKQSSEVQSESGAVSRMAILAGKVSAGNSRSSRPLLVKKLTNQRRSRLEYALQNMSANPTLRPGDDDNDDPDISGRTESQPLGTRDPLENRNVFFEFCSGLTLVDQQAASQLEIHKKFSEFCSSTLRTSFAPYETDFGCWYGKMILFKDFKESKPGSRFSIWESKATTVHAAVLHMRNILKNGSRVNGEYLLEKPVCAIVGSLTWKLGRKTLLSDLVRQPAVVILQKGKNGLEMLQMDPRNIRDARIRPRVKDFAKLLKVKLIKLLPGSSNDSSMDSLLACYKYIGQVLDGTYHNDGPLVRTYHVSKARFEPDTFEVKVAMK